MLRRLCLLVLLASTPARAEPEKFALIIGNSDYDHLPDLANPRIDANGIAQALGKLGFTVETLIDAPSFTLTATVERLSKLTRNAQPDSVLVFYYAGHGFEENGENILATRDYTSDDVRDRTSVKLRDIITRLAPTGDSASYFFIDACRTTAQTNSRSGFVREEPPPNTLIAFSTSLGTAATDGIPGAGSPFAIALEYSVGQRGATGSDLMELVQNRVSGLIPSQTPVYYSNITTKSYINKSGRSERDRRTSLAFKAGRDRLWPEALRLARQSAQDGDVDAMLFLINNLKDNANATEKGFNPKEAYKWARAAKNSEDRWGKLYYAQYIGNILLAVGDKFPKYSENKDTAAAVAILESESENGIPIATAILGSIELRKARYGVGAKADPARAVQLLKQAFDAGVFNAAYDLAFAYLHGLGVAKDEAKATELYRLMYERGLLDGGEFAMSIWSVGSGKRTEADKEAFHILSNGSKNGGIIATYGLAISYYLGVGVEQDRAKALALLSDLEVSGKRKFIKFGEVIARDIKDMRNGSFKEHAY